MQYLEQKFISWSFTRRRAGDLCLEYFLALIIVSKQAYEEKKPYTVLKSAGGEGS